MKVWRPAAALIALGMAIAGRAEEPTATTTTSATEEPKPTTSATEEPKPTTSPTQEVKATTSATQEPKTTISGKAYVDYSYRDNVDHGKGVAADKGIGTALDIKRFYLGVDHAFDSVWRARIRTDIGNLTNGKFDVFVKHAFVEARVAPALDLKAGSADLPWVPYVEELYGFRYVENVLIDRIKYGTSADWGFHVGGKVGGGMLDYAVSAVNGRGYVDPTRTRAPTVEARLGLSPVKGFTVAVGGQAGKLGQNVVGTATPRTATRADALLAWVGGGARIGATGFLARNYDKAIVTGTAPMDTAAGASAWASYEIVPSVTLFARGDWVQPRRDTSSGLRDLYANAGLQVEPVKALDVALVYKREQVKSGSLATSNGTIGSAVAGSSGTYNEVGVFAQYVF